MSEFTPLVGLVGGTIIGASAVVLLLFKGRVAGLSGIVNGVFSRDLSEMSWRLAFIIGIVLGPFIANLFGSYLPESFDFSWTKIIVAAFLVGFGTNLSGGCTSGHGICGVGRFAPRSIWATAMFMLFAMLTVILLRFFVGEQL
jgi:uncharacterized protein